MKRGRNSFRQPLKNTAFTGWFLLKGYKINAELNAKQDASLTQTMFEKSALKSLQSTFVPSAIFPKEAAFFNVVAAAA